MENRSSANVAVAKIVTMPPPSSGGIHLVRNFEYVESMLWRSILAFETVIIIETMGCICDREYLGRSNLWKADNQGISKRL